MNSKIITDNFDLIQKVDEVKDSFSAIEASIKMNESSISALEMEIKEKNQSLNERLFCNNS